MVLVMVVAADSPADDREDFQVAHEEVSVVETDVEDLAEDQVEVDSVEADLVADFPADQEETLETVIDQVKPVVHISQLQG